MPHTPSPKNYVVRVNAGVTGLSLPGVGTSVDGGVDVEMTPEAFAHMNTEQLAAITVTQVASDGTLTPQQLNDLTTDAELAAALAALPAPPPGVFTPNADNTAIIPLDNSDSWIVGSDRMDRDTLDTTKDIRAFFNKAKGAFRAGIASGGAWDNSVVGLYSHAEGRNTTASGEAAHAEGQGTNAAGTYSHAEGTNTVVNGLYAHAEGQSTLANGTQSHAEGRNSQATGTSSHAEGDTTKATGINSHAEGLSTTASGNNSHAEGGGSVASRLGQHAKASGWISAAGDSQACNMVLRRVSTDAAAAPLTAANGTITLTGEGTSVLTLPASRTFKVKIDVVARRTDVAGEHAGWSFEGLIARDATGNAYFVGTLDGKAWGTTGAAAWDLTPSINTVDATNNYLALTATGEAAKTIRWVASINWVEVG